MKDFLTFCIAKLRVIQSLRVKFPVALLRGCFTLIKTKPNFWNWALITAELAEHPEQSVNILES